MLALGAAGVRRIHRRGATRGICIMKQVNKLRAIDLYSGVGGCPLTQREQTLMLKDLGHRQNEYASSR